MADDERLRLRSSLAELLSPAQVTQAARGTVTVHDEPVVGGGVKGDAGQDSIIRPLSSPPLDFIALVEQPFHQHN